MPLLVLLSRSGYWCSMCAVTFPSLRSLEPSIASTPPRCGAVARLASSSAIRRGLTCSWFHRLGQQELQALHCRMLGTDYGLGARQAVSALLRSRGSGNSARYSRNPRRYGQQVVACGAGFHAGRRPRGHGTRRAFTGTPGTEATLPCYLPTTAPPHGQQTTARKATPCTSWGCSL